MLSIYFNFFTVFIAECFGFTFFVDRQRLSQNMAFIVNLCLIMGICINIKWAKGKPICFVI